ncbi:16S rRNA (uracil(1498)-N(3))-methyltransferase [Candidatus Sumerlaeota bacterium]|nr:16S rRNA (uracil(1498)-N(3))-methyltransferase [Candidatus Sumerlaeota bacterium]
MRIYRCYHASSPKPGDVVALDDNEIQHLAAARRIRPGDKATLINGMGAEFAATVAESHRRALTLQVEKVVRQDSAPPYTLRLAAAITKGPDFDDMMQRAVELGITHFQPLFSERVAVELDPFKTEKRIERWKRLAVEALKQCERLWLPKVHHPITIAEFLALGGSNEEHRIVLHERRDGIPRLLDVLASRNSIIIGPEGGWSPQESELFVASDCQLASLTGESILRAETAALMAVSLALAKRA